MIIVELLICLFAAAFFAGMETGLLAADQMAVYLKKQAGDMKSRAAHYLLLKPERLLGTTLVGTNVAVVTAAVLFSSYLSRYGYAWASWLGSIFLSLILLVFSEIIPKSFFRRHADTQAIRLAPVLVLFYILFFPVSLILNTLVQVLIRMTGGYRPHTKLPQSREDLRLLVRLGSRDSGLDREDRRFFEDIFDFRDTVAREVMVQIHTYPVCAENAPLKAAVEMGEKAGIRFLPVYRGRADNIVGCLDLEDLLRAESDSVGAVMSEPVFYPETKKIPKLLLEMNENGLDAVFLSDEYGAVTGMITPADIAAEIVGFFQTSGQEETEIGRTASGQYLVSGKMDIEDLQHEMGILLPKGDYDTIAGYICQRLGEIPQKGRIFEENGIRYRVLDRDKRRIKRLEIERIVDASKT